MVPLRQSSQPGSPANIGDVKPVPSFLRLLNFAGKHPIHRSASTQIGNLKLDLCFYGKTFSFCRPKRKFRFKVSVVPDDCEHADTVLIHLFKNVNDNEKNSKIGIIPRCRQEEYLNAPKDDGGTNPNLRFRPLNAYC